MTLRDYFAGQALAGIAARKIYGVEFLYDDEVCIAYKYADAMLQERARTSK
jgi:hypothetical protein